MTGIIKENNKSFFFLRFKDKAARDKFVAKGPFAIRNRQLKIKAALPSKSSLKKERSMKDIREFIARRSEVGKQKVSNNNVNSEIDG